MSKDHLGSNIKIRCFGLTFSGNNEVGHTYFRKEKGQYTRESGGSNRLMVGNSDLGGAGNANWNQPDNSNDNIGFRVAVVLFSLSGGGFNPTTKHPAYFLERRFQFKVFFIIKNF